ncbi:16S rRNA (cytidine(1402)-2'-O)-methyltransferase [Rhizorhabdus dicambivorans]|uniref:Ribosomal RNA small subunit methyltransferase I n=1 Tax=Rhizorhabdus dicambivorans TaxID=1850238 RepID=A0A2A4G2T8_9SPHN|nr:16S rRNA (cytidine(1402)-2'-O)-methyltransferase [Rhizorhabdus dicambivorans]ATE65063.1 16S rRNA (cytidine(1402)-2'-O)-methyltransferase [Rhizorhabdus dicambivorans]PCE44338.1 16S rRNA (cytidine(1402)-2'-O)-methyltransferase [Rhizorhabdus dicambivorans]
MNPSADHAAADAEAPEQPLPPGLYIVATPIGNLGDLSPRAASVLSRVETIAVEDSRVTAKLLQRIGIRRPMTPYHDHNADKVRPGLIARMASGPVALVSDAGTPLISDPGYKLVRDARAAGIAITTIPGPCAAIAALTLAGLPTDRFFFLGFLPSKEKARAEAIAEVAAIKATLILYESGPRLGATLKALAQGLGDREAAVVREISKTFEESVAAPLPDLAARYADLAPKGEIVVIVGPPGEQAATDPSDAEGLLRVALAHMPAAKAAGEVARATGLNRRDLYARALAIKDAD